MRFAWGSATDIGRVRSNNQDSYLVAPEVWAVADGMGGHRGGEVASHVAIDVLSNSYEDASVDGLRSAAERANDAVFHQASDDPDLRGMGTTLVAIAPVVADGGEPTLAWVNIGDSRLYRLRDGELDQISEDHSLVEEMVRDGRISADEARTHPQRNILTRALGIDMRASIDAGSIDPFEGDRYLLCSDGLFNEVDEPRIAATLRQLGEPGDAAKELVRLALEGGGRDNITVVVVDVVDDDDAAAKASAGIDEGTVDSHADAAAAAAAQPEKAPTKKEKGAKPKRFTLRVALFLLLFIAIVGATVFAVYRVARGGYTVKARGTTDVVIYQGNGNTVLWLDPEVDTSVAPVPYAAVKADKQQAVTAGQHFGSLAAAEAFLTAAQTGTPITTTTTTTTSTTSTTTSTTTTSTIPTTTPPP